VKGILSFGKDITDGDFNSALYAFLKKVCEFFFAPYGEMWTLDSKGRKLILSNVFYAREDKYKGFYKCWMNLNYLIIENLQESRIYKKRVGKGI
jgi:hypothetical protein